MLTEANAERHAALEQELGRLVYRRLLFVRELEAIDEQIVGVEGAIRENEATARDIATQAAIDAAQTADNGGQ